MPDTHCYRREKFPSHFYPQVRELSEPLLSSSRPLPSPFSLPLRLWWFHLCASLLFDKDRQPNDNDNFVHLGCCNWCLSTSVCVCVSLCLSVCLSLSLCLSVLLSISVSPLFSLLSPLSSLWSLPSSLAPPVFAFVFHPPPSSRVCRWSGRARVTARRAGSLTRTRLIS